MGAIQDDVRAYRVGCGVYCLGRLGGQRVAVYAHVREGATEADLELLPLLLRQRLPWRCKHAVDHRRRRHSPRTDLAAPRGRILDRYFAEIKVEGALGALRPVLVGRLFTQRRRRARDPVPTRRRTVERA